MEVNVKNRILLVTNLYPGYEGQSRKEITYAIHDIYRAFEKSFDIKTVRIWSYFPKVFDIFVNARKRRKLAINEKVAITDVIVNRVPVKSFPYLFPNKKEKKNAAKNIIELCRSDRFIPDIVICHMIEHSFEICRIISKYYKSPLVVALHNSDLKSLKGKNNANSIIRDCNGVVFRSEKIKREALKYLSNQSHMLSQEIQYILNSSIELKKVISQEAINAKIKMANRNFVLVSNLENTNKMVDVVIKAYIKMGKSDTTLSIIGGGPLKQSLEKMSASKKDIKFLGEIEYEEVQRKLNDADVFVLVSRNETFGLVYIEAMSKGCITIGSLGEGIDGFIIDRENGFLCKPGDVKSLTDVMIECYEMSIEEKARILNESIGKIRSMSKEKIISGYESYIKKIISLGQD